MSAYQYDDFERRMRRINRRHTKLSQGYVTSINDDGLVVAKPKAKGRGTTVRGVLLMVAVIMVFKGVLHAQLGPQAYQERVGRLADGNIVEQAGAFVMTADPVTLWLSQSMTSLVR